MPLFEVAIVIHPTEIERENGELEELIVAPEPVVANDSESAKKISVAKHLFMLNDISRVEILCRPFGNQQAGSIFPQTMIIDKKYSTGGLVPTNQ